MPPINPMELAALAQDASIPPITITYIKMGYWSRYMEEDVRKAGQAANAFLDRLEAAQPKTLAEARQGMKL